MTPAQAAQAQRKRRSRRRVPIWIWLLLAVVGIGGILYGVDLAMSEGRVPRGVTVGGVAIGGMTTDQAEQRLRLDLGDKTRQMVTVNAGNMSTTMEPTQAGLQVNWHDTVEQAGQQPLNPIERVRSFFKQREIGIISAVADEPFNRTMDRLSRELTRKPENAGLGINSAGKPTIKDDVPGQTIEPDALRDQVLKDWLNTNHIVHGDAEVTQAAIRTADAQKLVKDVVQPATSAPLTFRGRNQVTATIQPSDMASILTFVPDVPEGKDPAQAKSLKTVWNNDAARDILQKQLASTEVEFRNASFKDDGGKLTVVPHQDGVAIKWDETLGDIKDKALNTTKRDWDVVYEDKPATFTTEQAQKASFNDVMGEFTTSGFAQNSGVNIRRVAEMVNGAYVLPGETFSLNGYTGPRGTAQGFIDAGVIIDGRSEVAVGGGISQFATTLYNASYFAGMEDVAHTPHSFYISRYPAGREATVFEGAIDLQFKNPFNIPVRIESFVSGNSVTVRIKGTKQVEVESIPGPRTNPTQPQPRDVPAEDNCSPSSGAPGFTTTDTRVVRDLSGKELSRRTLTTVYDPVPIVRCV